MPPSQLIHYWETPEEFELYDLKADPEELHNLAADPAYATIKERLRSRMKELGTETGDTTDSHEP